MVARDENRNRNGHVLVWDQTNLDLNNKPDSMYHFHNFYIKKAFPIITKFN